ncbi:hypothetical protein OIDMADRAFT_141229 [Oidiodendron maius Zn]|uniref:Uncharacterized protein n=1 Tax=Oidiodendron maius (strain Zn) TaxID=913774 RepID=A0A0C3HR05_OIDMZ|nr:hypothetical protein OIDMADRAFT_141229 [Oidiodendron maius Zn]
MEQDAPTPNRGDIGYFDPDLEESYGLGDYVTVGTNVYWRNVYLFTDTVRDNATGDCAPLVRHNLVTCLRGSALRWYTSELSDLERTGLKMDIRGVTVTVYRLVLSTPFLFVRDLKDLRCDLRDSLGSPGSLYSLNLMLQAVLIIVQSHPPNHTNRKVKVSSNHHLLLQDLPQAEIETTEGKTTGPDPSTGQIKVNLPAQNTILDTDALMEPTILRTTTLISTQYSTQTMMSNCKLRATLLPNRSQSSIIFQMT